MKKRQIFTGIIILILIIVSFLSYSNFMEVQGNSTNLSSEL